MEKTIKLTDETWSRLTTLKHSLRAKNIDEVIRGALDQWNRPKNNES